MLADDRTWLSTGFESGLPSGRSGKSSGRSSNDDEEDEEGVPKQVEFRDGLGKESGLRKDVTNKLATEMVSCAAMCAR